MCQLLVVSNLEMYIPNFQSETIDGSLLLDLTDDILQEELGIERKIHRLKLMKFLSGEYSAEHYLMEQPYIQLVKPVALTQK